MENTSAMKALFMIVNAGFSTEIIDLVRSAGILGATVLHARGEGAQHTSFLGITVDTEREILLCITDEDTANKAMCAVKDKMGIASPAHSVCFTMPVEKAIGVMETAALSPIDSGQ